MDTRFEADKITDLLKTVTDYSDKFKNIPMLDWAEIEKKHPTEIISQSVQNCNQSNNIINNETDLYHIRNAINGLIENYERYSKTLTNEQPKSYDDFLIASKLVKRSDTNLFQSLNDLDEDNEYSNQTNEIKQGIELTREESAANDVFNAAEYEKYCETFKKDNQLKRLVVDDLKEPCEKLRSITTQLDLLITQVKSDKKIADQEKQKLHNAAMQKETEDRNSLLNTEAPAKIEILIKEVTKIKDELEKAIAANSGVIGKKDPARLLEVEWLLNQLNNLHTNKNPNMDHNQIMASMLEMVSASIKSIEQSIAQTKFVTKSATIVELNKILNNSVNKDYLQFKNPEQSSKQNKQPKNEEIKNRLFITEIARIVANIYKDTAWFSFIPDGVKQLNIMLKEKGLLGDQGPLNNQINDRSSDELRKLSDALIKIASDKLNERTLFGNPIDREPHLREFYFGISKNNTEVLQKLYHQSPNVNPNPSK